MASKKGESTALLPTTRPGNITTVPTSSSSSSSASTAFHRRERSASKRLLPNPLHDDEEDDDEEGDHHSSGIAAVRKVAPQPDHPHLYAREYLFMPYLPFLRFRDYHVSIYMCIRLAKLYHIHLSVESDDAIMSLITFLLTIHRKTWSRM